MSLYNKWVPFGLSLLCLVMWGCTQSITETTPVDVQESTDVAEQSSSAESSLQVNGFYTVDIYDASRDAAADLAATVKLAKADNKRILLEIGGDW